MTFYHVLNRGTEKRSIARDNVDRLRFVLGLYAFNTEVPVLNFGRDKVNGVEPRSGERLVNIEGWCLMDNHYHLLISAEPERLGKFLQKFATGYTMYFNLRHERSGALFQGKTKRVQVTSHAHYNYILPYIHCNPLDLQKQTSLWRSQCVSNPRGALECLKRYRWSSYRNYCGEPEFSEILEGSELFKHSADHVTGLRRFLSFDQDASLSKLNLE